MRSRCSRRRRASARGAAPTSEAIYAEITSRYGARKLAELQDMLGELERGLAAMEVAGDGDAEPDE